MRNGNLVFSAINFLIVIAFFIAAFLFFRMHYSAYFRIQVTDWIQMKQGNFWVIGSLTLSIASALACCFYSMQKGHYIRIQMEPHSFEYDETFVKNAINHFWEENFSDEPKLSSVYFSKGKIELLVPPIKRDLKEIETHLGVFLSNTLGYKSDFFITFKS